MKPILEIHNISKKFFIDHERPSYLSFRDRLANAFTRRAKPEEFWALRDVSFDVMPGDSIGIIGRNGAGKSTLLKILSRITPPTEGHIIARGRVASLLEVGTGFHQELTGRENIFMNGSILGMKRAEIKRRFDEIVDFSGVEKFLDTPLKHYSSGMQLRLAFAVAAHLEPEILIIDEVLAVGDAEFQRRCMGKMEEVSKSGRTVLFVSHNMSAISQLCLKTLWFNKGEVEQAGETNATIRSYISEGNKQEVSKSTFNIGEGVVIQNLKLCPNPLQSNQDFKISFGVHTDEAITIDSIGFYINNLMQERMGIIDLRKGLYHIKAGGELLFNIHTHKLPLVEGEYWVGIFFGSNLVSGNFDECIKLDIQSSPSNSDVVPYSANVRGKVEFDFEFYVNKS